MRYETMRAIYPMRKMQHPSAHNLEGVCPQHLLDLYIGTVVRVWRFSYRMTAIQMAQILNVNSTNVGLLETGKMRWTEELIAAASAALGLVAALINESSSVEAPSPIVEAYESLILEWKNSQTTKKYVCPVDENAVVNHVAIVLRAKMAKTGVTQTHLAEMSGVSQSQISRYLLGEAITVRVLVVLCAALKIEVSAIFSEITI